MLMTRTVRMVLLGLATKHFAANANSPAGNRLSWVQGHAEDAAALAHDDIRTTAIPPDSIATSHSNDGCATGDFDPYSGKWVVYKCDRQDGWPNPLMMIDCPPMICPPRCCSALPPAPVLPTPAPAPAPAPAPQSTVPSYFGPSMLLLTLAGCGVCLLTLAPRMCQQDEEVDERETERARGALSVREVEAGHAEPCSQPGLPRAAPAQALCSRAQVDPLAPSAPLSPAPSVEEHRQEAESSKPDCVICMAAPAEFACLPCGHMCGCLPCLSKVRRCPICRQQVEKAVKVFLATA